MLKISYSDTKIALEQLPTTPEAVVARHSIFALRAGQSVYAQAGCGSLLVPTQLPEISAFVDRVTDHPLVDIDLCDRAWLEVTLRGVWIAETPQSEAGILVTDLGEATEGGLVALWQRGLGWTLEPSQIPKAC